MARAPNPGSATVTMGGAAFTVTKVTFHFSLDFFGHKLLIGYVIAIFCLKPTHFVFNMKINHNFVQFVLVYEGNISLLKPHAALFSRNGKATKIDFESQLLSIMSALLNILH